MNFKTFYLNEATNSFVIPEKIKKNYKISGNLSNINNWKAKIILGNSMRKDQKVGDWDDVGYVAISIKDNTIIPIARSDEHRAGHELVYHLYEKKLIPTHDYITIFDGSNYIYNESELSDAKIVYQKWLSWGGKNTTVEHVNGTAAGFMTDYINANSLKELAGMIQKGKLNPFGKRLIEDLEELAKQSNIVNKTEKLEDIEKFNNMALDFLDVHVWNLIHMDISKITESEKSINKNFEDYKNTDQILFGMNGIKNQIHQALRNVNKAKDEYKYDKLVKIFGDLVFAKKEFDRLSNI